MFSQYKYYFYGIASAALYWFIDSTVDYHRSVTNAFELVPGDFTELWMRLVIVTQFIVLGAVVHRQVKQIHDSNIRLQEEVTQRHQSQLEAQQVAAKILIEQEKAAIYLSTVQAAHHIVNNLLNQLQLFKIAAEKASDFNKETLALYDVVTGEATNLISKLSEVENITSNNIHNSVHPN